MRISSLIADPGYTPHFYRYRVWLAGAERSNVQTADDTKRYAVTLARDEYGRPVLDKAGNQRTQEFWGDVRIEYDPEDHDSQTDDALSLSIYGAMP